MAQAPRLNKVIELLEQGKVVFGGGMAWTGNIDEAMAFADMGYDFVIFEMEHEGFHLPGLRLSLQFLLIARKPHTRGYSVRSWPAAVTYRSIRHSLSIGPS